MRRFFAFVIIAVGALCSTVKAWSTTPDDVEAFMRQARSQADAFLQQKITEASAFEEGERIKVKAFRDSLNALYGDELAKGWSRFNLEEKKRNFKPVPRPVVEPKEPEEPEETPLPSKPVTEPEPLPVDHPTYPQPPVESPKGVTVEFFGETYDFPKMKLGTLSLNEPSDKAVANLWKHLSKMDFEEMIEGFEFLQADLHPGDWGNVLIVKSLIKAYFPTASANARIVAEAFFLNQLGYDARICRNESDLFLVLPFRQIAYNTKEFSHNHQSYAVINPEHKPLTNVYMSDSDYYEGQRKFDMALTQLPRLEGDLATYKAFFETYPCVEFSVYGNAPLSPPMVELIDREIAPLVKGLDTVGAVNALLRYMFKFAYKTDEDNYGYEKWNFAEESIIEPYTDCDDNAILFSHLVRHILGLDAVLIFYPGVHLAAAVDLGEANRGDTVTCNGRTYTVCDPTFEGSKAGMEMPMPPGQRKEIIPLKR